MFLELQISILLQDWINDAEIQVCYDRNELHFKLLQKQKTVI